MIKWLLTAAGAALLATGCATTPSKPTARTEPPKVDDPLHNDGQDVDGDGRPDTAPPAPDDPNNPNKPQNPPPEKPDPPRP